MSHVYVLDSDVFIAAKNAYYAFDICPGFWVGLLEAHQRQRLRSIDKIKEELLRGHPDEDLVRWTKTRAPNEFFRSTQESDVIDAYKEIVAWAARSTQYFPAAKDKFATEADGWLVAYSIVHGTTVVTNEQPRPHARNRILLPDVCAQFAVPVVDTFSLLRELALKFELRSAELREI